MESSDWTRTELLSTEMHLELLESVLAPPGKMSELGRSPGAANHLQELQLEAAFRAFQGRCVDIHAAAKAKDALLEDAAAGLRDSELALTALRAQLARLEAALGASASRSGESAQLRSRGLRIASRASTVQQGLRQAASAREVESASQDELVAMLSIKLAEQSTPGLEPALLAPTETAPAGAAAAASPTSESDAEAGAVRFSEAASCSICHADFSLFVSLRNNTGSPARFISQMANSLAYLQTRRHHCRECGTSVCDSHSTHRSLQGTRQCDDCHAMSSLRWQPPSARTSDAAGRPLLPSSTSTDKVAAVVEGEEFARAGESNAYPGAATQQQLDMAALATRTEAAAAETDALRTLKSSLRSAAEDKALLRQRLDLLLAVLEKRASNVPATDQERSWIKDW